MIFERKINYYETDAMKIVHHSNYIRFLEEARISFMDKINLPYSKMEEVGILIPVLGVNCTYKTPAKFDDIIQIDVKIKEYNGVRLVMEYEIRNKKTNALVLIGETKHCFTNTELKPISLKKANIQMHELLEKAKLGA
jgi:acyl-CoA thioester hydrolase